MYNKEYAIKNVENGFELEVYTEVKRGGWFTKDKIDYLPIRYSTWGFEDTETCTKKYVFNNLEDMLTWIREDQAQKKEVATTVETSGTKTKK